MPNTREKLIDILDEVQHYGISTNPGVNCVYNSDIADHLIANGVTVVDKFATTERRWISVKDRLPDRDGWYITQTNATGRGNGTLPQEFEIRNGVGRWRYRDRLSPWNTTHWQPMPQPPKGE